MEDPETLATLDTQDTGRKQAKQNKNTTQKTNKQMGINPGAREEQTVSASYKTPAMLRYSNSLI